jgi:hypothetical protein
MPIAIPFDLDKKVYEGNSSTGTTVNTLYNTQSSHLQSKKFSVDRPSDYISLQVIDNLEDEIIFYYDKFFYNTSSQTSVLLNCNFYTNLKNLYNYIDLNHLNTLEYNIFTINNDYSIIAGKDFLFYTYHNLYATE